MYYLKKSPNFLAFFFEVVTILNFIFIIPLLLT